MCIRDRLEVKQLTWQQFDWLMSGLEIEQPKAFKPCLLYTSPGITGMWQVSGRSDITDFEEVVKLDTEYIRNWSMGLDFRILFKTVAAVLKRDGSM